MAPVFTTLGN